MKSDKWIVQYLHFVKYDFLVLSFDCHLYNWNNLSISHMALSPYFNYFKKLFPFSLWSQYALIGSHVLINLGEIMIILSKVHERNCKSRTSHLACFFDLIPDIVLYLLKQLLASLSFRNRKFRCKIVHDLYIFVLFWDSLVQTFWYSILDWFL